MYDTFIYKRQKKNRRNSNLSLPAEYLSSEDGFVFKNGVKVLKNKIKQDIAV